MSVSTRLQFFLFFLFLTGTFSAVELRARPRIFATFEDKSDLSQILTSAGVDLSISTRFPLHEEHSLEVAFPATGGSIEFTEVPRDWVRRGSAFASRGTPWQDEVLLFFVWSVEAGELTVTFQDFSGSTHETIRPVRTGANHIQLSFEGTEAVDLRRMRSLRIARKGQGTLYLDYFALDRFHEALEDKGRWDVDYTMEIETPHIPWGRPFGGGPTKVFTIGNARGAGRGIIELAERLELDFRVTTLENSGFDFGDFYFHRRGGPSLSNTYLADDFLNGPSYDVILWPDLRPWDSYPIEVRNNIRQRVSEGAGLILFHPRTTGAKGDDLWEISPLTAAPGQSLDRSQWKPTKAHYITDGVPLDAFPWGHISVEGFEAGGDVLLETEDGRPVLAVKRVGEGRVAAFSYREMGMIPAVENPWETDLHYPYQEYLWSLVARTVVWAAGKEPETRIAELESSVDAVRVSFSDIPGSSVLTARIGDDLGVTQDVLEFPLAIGTKEISVPLQSHLPGGDLFVDLRILSDERSQDWASLRIRKQPLISISEVRLDNDKIEMDSQVSGKILVRGFGPDEALLSIRLVDNYGRLIDQQSNELAGLGEIDVPFELSPADALTHLLRVHAEVSVDSLRQDVCRQEVFLVKPRKPWDDYEIIMYSGSNPLPGLWPIVDRQLQRFFVTALCWYPLDLVNHANYGVQASVRVSGTESPDGAARAYYNEIKERYAATRDKKVLVREHCLNDPAYFDLLRREIEGFVSPWVHLSPLAYFVYEEPSLTCYGDALDICFGDHCMRAFREWLQTQYGSLNAVNRQWGTAFTDWKDVVPDDTYEAQARGNFASWADHREFMDISLAQSYAFIGNELKHYDPQAIQLLSGTQSGVHSGQDYSRLDPLLGYIDAGAERTEHMHKNFNPRIKLSVNGRAPAPGKLALYNMYSGLFAGCTDGAFLFWQYSMLNPDYTLNLTSGDTIAALRELREEGIGKLVSLSELDNYGIALHYSYPSKRGTWIVDGVVRERVAYDTSETYSRFQANWEGWRQILTDAGLQYAHLPYSAVEKGELISGGYRVLILPMSIALSEQEVDAIGDFVEQGGQVIADALPGVMDRHCTFRKRRVLDELFGVQFAPVKKDAVIAMSGEPHLRLAGAHTLVDNGSPPLLLEHSYGSGRAYLLNHFLDSYTADRLGGKANIALRRFKEVMHAAGLQPKVQVTTVSGDPIPDIALYLFRVGSTRLLGLMPDKYLSGSQRIRIHFQRPAAIYDVRHKRYLGIQEFFETDVEAAVPELFALLQDRITGMKLQTPEIAGLGEEVEVNFQIEGVGDLRSVVRLTVTDPNGRQHRYYGGNRDIAKGRGSARFRLALNDSPGDWYITVTEVMSGETGRAVITVQE